MFVVSVDGAPTIDPPGVTQVVVALVAVDMITYLRPSILALAVGNVTTK